MALGATIGEAAFGHRLGRKAMLFGGFCGLVPDLDFLFTGGDSWVSLQIHRGISHSFIALPAAALILGYVAWRLARRHESAWQWIHLAFWALMTHPVLDVFTVYGTMVLEPLTNRRFAIDGAAIVDLFYSIPLAVIIVRAIRRRIPVERSRRHAWIVLGATTAYLLLGLAQSQWAIVRASEQLDEDGFAAVHVRAAPTLFNNGLFRVVAADDEGNVAVGLTTSWAPGNDIDFVYYEWPENNRYLDAAMASEKGQIFAWFSGGFLRAESEPRPGGEPGALVRLVDTKYGSVHDLDFVLFGAEFIVTEELDILSAITGPRSSFDIGAEFGALWSGYWGSWQPPIPKGGSPTPTPAN